jgi:ORF6N domain
MASKKKSVAVPVAQITQSIVIIRGQRVLLDRDLAEIYGVTTGRLNEAIKRNRTRFPEDFMFQLTVSEAENLKSQFAISSWGGRRKLPFVFTEHGAIQAANVLRSTRAVEMGIYVVRAFVQLRDLLTSNKELAKRVDELEKRIVRKLDTHDQAITEIIKTIRQLMNPPEPKKRSIGFVELQEKKR